MLCVAEQQHPLSKVLVLIVAYNAEKTLCDVLERIPPDLWDSHDMEILVIDDFSADDTFGVGLAFEQANSKHRIRVLRTPENQGYGGNQKLGYRYAMDHGFDFVALVHGDGQYAPEKLPDLLQPLIDRKADAVFGSRMLERGSALRGGMPLYKYVGNRILSGFENLLLRTNLSEFHSGYRVYAVDALRGIPFERNTNDFHFDTEIIIQLIIAGKHIHEIPIQTYYGDEICHVNGMKYAWDVFRAVMRLHFHKMSLLYDRKYDLDTSNEAYGLKLGYPSSHTLAMELVNEGDKVLDIGCGQGLVAEEICLRKKALVTGIDQFAHQGPHGTHPGLTLINADVDGEELPVDATQFDCVLMLDVIEHLRDPEGFMERLRARVAGRRPRLVLTTGNVAFFVVRMALLLGQFNYGRKGILDRSHTRLFTFKTIRNLLEQCGFTVTGWQGIPAPFPEAIGRNILSRFLLTTNQLLIRVLPGVFSYQILVTARARPTVKWLLAETERQSDHLREKKRKQNA